MDEKILERGVHETWGFLKLKFQHLFQEMLKIGLIVTAIGILTLIALAIVIYFGSKAITLVDLFGVSLILISFVLAVVAIALIGMYLMNVAGSINYNIVDSTFKKTPISFMEKFNDNLLPILKFIIVDTAIGIIVFGPFFILLFGTSIAIGTINTPAAVLVAQLVEIVFRIIISIVGAALYLFLQFAIFELLISKRGVIESFRKSIDIVRKRPLETLIFSFGLWMIESLLAIPFLIVLLILVIIFAIIGVIGGVFGYLATAMSGGLGGLLILLVVILFGAIIFGALFLIFGAIKSAVNISTRYVFWNKLK